MKEFQLTDATKAYYESCISKIDTDKITFSLWFYEKDKTGGLYLALMELVDAGLVKVEIDEISISGNVVGHSYSIVEVTKLS